MSLRPGQIIPVAYIPLQACEGEDEDDSSIFSDDDSCISSDSGSTKHTTAKYMPSAELVLLVTEDIPAKTMIWVVPNGSDEGRVRDEALWIWTSPENMFIKAGTVLRLQRLGFKKQPVVNIGTVQKSGQWPSHSFSISAFTLYSLSPNGESCGVADTAHAVTALYSTHAFPIPSGLVFGHSVSSTPWPCYASLVAHHALRTPCPEAWVLLKLKLLAQKPVRWLC